MKSPRSQPIGNSCLSAYVLATAICGGVVQLSAASAADADLPAALQAKVDASLVKAVAWLKSQPRKGGAESSLTCYALLKGGVPHDFPELKRHADSLLRKMASGSYQGISDPAFHTYEAGCDAMFLEALDPVLYAPQLQEIRDYLIRRQLPSGGWFYPAVPPGPSGDTSITQYGVLGLWAIQRTGIDVPRQVWGNIAKFHSATQRFDGGFTYHPYAADAQATKSTAAMSAAGLGSTLVAQLMLFGPNAETEPREPSRRRFGVLEQLTEQAPKAPRKTSGESGVSREVFKKLIPGAERAIERLFNDGLNGPHPIYFLYGCERAGALLGSSTLGGLPWYERGAEFLTQRQQPDGSWEVNVSYSAATQTAFAILFLARATKSLVPQNRTAPRKVGTGLLVGGRGLPTDLSNVNLDDGSVKRRVPKQGVDSLLTELEQPTEASVREIQQTFVESVELDRPEELVGQTERLRRLLNHPEPEVRQVAVWALARSGDLRDALRLIALLEDPDVVVAWEASLGLCVISRFPTGIVPAGEKEPLPIMPPGAASESAEPDPTLAAWRQKTIAAWDAWYQQVRPYEERDDQRQLRNR